MNTAAAHHQNMTTQSTALLAANFIAKSNEMFMREDQHYLKQNTADALNDAAGALGQRGPHAEAAIMMAFGATRMYGFRSAITHLNALANA